MLPVKFETCTHLKHLKSMVTHRLSCFSYVFLLANSTCWPLIHFFYRPTQRVGLSLFFTGQLNVLAYLFLFFFFLLANSTCWPISVQPDGSHQLLSLAFPHARKIFLEVLTINHHKKLLKHVGISRQNLINLVWPVPSWRPLAIFSIFGSQW